MSEGTQQQKNEGFTIMTVRDVAEYLRVSEAKVYRLAKDGELPVFRIGKAWRFRKDLLDDWLSRSVESNLKVGGTQPQGAEGGVTSDGVSRLGTA